MVYLRLKEMSYIDKNTLSENTDGDFQFDYISLSDVKNGIIANNLPRLKFSESPSRARKIIHRKDILVSSVRPNLEGFAQVKYADTSDKIASTGFSIISPKSGYSSDYIYQYLFSHHIRSQFYALVVGSNYPAITTKDMRNLKFYIPQNIGEQKAIVSILETWDTAIEKTEHLIAAKEKRFKWLLKTLISDQQNNPDWKKMKLKNVAQMGSGGTPKSTISEYYGGDVSWVSITDMTTQGMWIKKTARSITTLGLKNSSARIYPKNSVLYAMYASLGECSILDINASSSQAILGITPFPNKLHYEYLYYYLSSIKERVKLQGQWGTQSNLNIEIVKNFHIPIPTLPLQKNITLILNTIQHETGILKNLAEKYRTQKRGLMQKLLTENTKGKH